MNIRRQQEMELEAALHGVPVKKQRIARPAGTPSSAVAGLDGPRPLSSETEDLDRQLSAGIAKGLPIKIIKRKK